MAIRTALRRPVLMAGMPERLHPVNAQLRHAPDGRFAPAGDASVRRTDREAGLGLPVVVDIVMNVAGAMR
jgi:hypothetical protein